MPESSPEFPDAMLTKGRLPVEHFEKSERLYRRIPSEETYFDFASGSIEMDAVELPDMSVNRAFYGPMECPMEWLLIDYPDAGIASFLVGQIPPSLQHLGITWYSFLPVHRPERHNWPHSQVEVYESDRPVSRPTDGRHVDGKRVLIEPEISYRWRYQLWCQLRLLVAPRAAIH